MTLEDYKNMENVEEAIKLAAQNREDEDAQEFLSDMWNSDEDIVKGLADKGNENVRHFIWDTACEDDHEELCREGYEWAFEWFGDDGDIGMYDSTDLMEFLLDCADNGSKKANELLLVYLDNCYDDAATLQDLAEASNGSCTATEFLCKNMANFRTYEWLKYVKLNEDFAVAIEQNLELVLNYEDELKYIEESAKNKNPYGQYLMGVIYSGVCPDIMPENKSLAKRYFDAALKGGCKLVNQFIATQTKKESERQAAETRIKKEKAEKNALLEDMIAKAEAGALSTEEYYQLANDLDKSSGIKGASQKATKYYKKAAEKGNDHAQYYLGLRLIEGKGCRKNWQAGMKWIRKASEQHNPAAKAYLDNNDTFPNRLFHKIFK